jgi:BlaI family transcriptional regulator, penicillinase repressor
MTTMSPKLTRLELQVMQALWDHGDACSIREVQESFPARKRPAYTTVQTLIYRLEEKKAVRRTRKVGNAHLFEPIVSRDHAHRRLIDDLLAIFGGRSLPVLSHLIESGNLTLEDVKEAEEMLRKAGRAEKPK